MGVDTQIGQKKPAQKKQGYVPGYKKPEAQPKQDNWGYKPKGKATKKPVSAYTPPKKVAPKKKVGQHPARPTIEQQRARAAAKRAGLLPQKSAALPIGPRPFGPGTIPGQTDMQAQTPWGSRPETPTTVQEYAGWAAQPKPVGPTPYGPGQPAQAQPPWAGQAPARRALGAGPAPYEVAAPPPSPVGVGRGAYGPDPFADLPPQTPPYAINRPPATLAPGAYAPYSTTGSRYAPGGHAGAQRAPGAVAPYEVERPRAVSQRAPWAQPQALPRDQAVQAQRLAAQAQAPFPIPPPPPPPTTAAMQERAQQAAAARQKQLAQATAAGAVPRPFREPMGKDEIEAFNVPWDLMGFDSKDAGYDWSKQFKQEYGVWPWEYGTGDENENLGRALQTHFGQSRQEEIYYPAAGYMAGGGEGYNPYTEGIPSEFPTEGGYGGGYGGGGFYGFGGGGGGSYETSSLPPALWFYLSQQAGI